MAQKDYAAAQQLVTDYHKQFPADEIFPLKAKAMVEYRRGSVQQGLAVYEQNFQPLWAPELVKSYFDLLTQTQSLRKFLDQARAALNANPEDLNAMARSSTTTSSKASSMPRSKRLQHFACRRKPASPSGRGRNSMSALVCWKTFTPIPSRPATTLPCTTAKGMNDAQERALAALTNLLLTAPETSIRLGSGELSMYRDIATMDQGPGYLNGILSLILNTTAPAAKFSEEEQRAIPYFHRSRAAELLALLDAKFPNSSERPELHAKLLEFYASSGESEAVIRGGSNFLTNFPHAPQRTSVALLMADAYARTGKTQEEFSIYDSVLQELALKAEKMPLGQSGDSSNYSQPADQETSYREYENTSGATFERERETRHFRCAQRQQPTSLGPARPSIRVCWNAIWPAWCN